MHVISRHFCNKTFVVVVERVLRMSAGSHLPPHIAVFHSVNVKYASFRLGEDTNARSKNVFATIFLTHPAYMSLFVSWIVHIA